MCGIVAGSQTPKLASERRSGELRAELSFGAIFGPTTGGVEIATNEAELQVAAFGDGVATLSFCGLPSGGSITALAAPVARILTWGKLASPVVLLADEVYLNQDSVTLYSDHAFGASTLAVDLLPHDGLVGIGIYAQDVSFQRISKPTAVQVQSNQAIITFDHGEVTGPVVGHLTGVLYNGWDYSVAETGVVFTSPVAESGCRPVQFEYVPDPRSGTPPTERRLTFQSDGGSPVVSAVNFLSPTVTGSTGQVSVMGVASQLSAASRLELAGSFLLQKSGAGWQLKGHATSVKFDGTEVLPYRFALLRSGGWQVLIGVVVAVAAAAILKAGQLGFRHLRRADGR